MAQHQHQHQHQHHTSPFANSVHHLTTTSFLLFGGTNTLFASHYPASRTKIYLTKRSAKPKAVFPESRRPTRKLRASPRSDAQSKLKATFREVVYTVDGLTSARLDKSLRKMMHVIDGPADRNMQPSGASQDEETVLDISALPQELLKKVFKHTTTADLISLSLVSKSFRDVAAEQLYQNFHIVFPDEDDPSNDSTIDGLAGGLDTFVTSEYNYAQYLREIALYTLSGGEKAERAYRPYLYALSCGKFLNTLLLMTLRKAKSLEKFRWDIRVELSRPVFQALHQISSLTELHLRMQFGSTQYEPPPPIPSLVNTASDDLSHGISAGHSGKKGSKLGKSQDSKLQQDPPTFSGFRRLKSLSILEIDSHDYGLELKTCIRNSSHTLSKLQLSFSETLASRSRKPPPEIPQDPESDEDVEDFNNSLPGPLDDGGHPAKVYRAKEERKKQENVLAEIFGLADNPSIVPPLKPDRTKLVLPEGSIAASDEFVKELKAAAHKYLESVIASGALQDQESCAKILAEIKASIAKIYKSNSMVIEKEHAKKLKAQLSAFEQSLAAMNVDGELGEDLAAGLPSLDDTSLPETQSQQTDVVMSGAADVEQPSLFDESTKDKKDITTNTSDPDDIKVDEPETNELSIEEGEPTQTEAEDANPAAGKEEPSSAEHPPIVNSPLLERAAQLLPMLQWAESPDLETLETGLQQLQTIRSGVVNGHPHIDRDGFRLSVEDVDELLNLCREMHQVRKTEIDSNTIECQQREKKVLESYAKVMDDQKQRDYVRQTRGLMLETLSIYLIPIKASVLSKALNLQVLQDITLLNCGSQVPFWSMLARENKSNPLSLNKIHTDNVTKPFLQLVSQLSSVTELCLLEKAQKSRTESFAAKSTMRIDDIRRLALKKHASTLRVLKIKNEIEHSWDVNEKTMMLLCRRAKRLEELGLCFGIKALHTLLQNNSGLSCLRAFHIVQFRQDDTCLWVSREVRKFTIDCFSQNPAMQLEYLAFDNSLERLVRKDESLKPKPSNAKTKTKSQVMDIGEDIPSINITWDSGVGGSGSSSEESEDDLGGMIGGLKIDTIEGIRFHDVAGVKIFTNEVLLGRL